jgi:hypothetical protein
LELHIANGQIFPYNTDPCEELYEQFTLYISREDCGMSKSTAERLSIAVFNTAVAVSALVMLWLLWHFPIVTVMTALFLVAGVAVLANFTKSLDVQPADDLAEDLSQDDPARLPGLR